MPAKRNLKVYRDDDYVHRITFQNQDLTAKDVSGYTFLAQLQVGVDAIDFDVDESEADDGIITLSLERDVTLELPVGAHRWDLQATLIASDFQETWLKGSVLVSGDVTRTGS